MGGDRIRIPEDVAGHMAVLLFFGTIAYAGYSSGKVGRFAAADAMTVAKGSEQEQSGQ